MSFSQLTSVGGKHCVRCVEASQIGSIVLCMGELDVDDEIVRSLTINY